jgi:hypothetical protein
MPEHSLYSEETIIGPQQTPSEDKVPMEVARLLAICEASGYDLEH